MSNNVDFPGLMVVELSNHCVPTFEYTNNKEWVKYGNNNAGFDYLIDLYNRNAIHGAIVKGKSAYVYGKGLCYESEGSILDKARIELWLENANHYETWNEVYEKICKYLELFNGFALQIIWDYKGRIAEVYCMEFAKLRRSKDGKKVMYCDNWIDQKGVPIQSPENDKSYKVYDIFNPQIRTGTQILYFKVDHPSTQKYGHLYPIPEYGQCTADIETDIEITNFHFHNLKNGMFASALLTMFNGEPSAPQKKEIKKLFNYTHSGSVNTGKLIFQFVDKGGQAADLKSLTPSDLDKQFEQLGKRLQQNIFTGHRADPTLFSVKTDNGISNPTGEQILVEWDKFQRAYVEPRQQIILTQIKMLGEINGNDLTLLKVEQTTPVGRELPSDPNILELFDRADLQKYYAERYGIKVSAPLVSASPNGVLAEGMINEHIKTLTGKQWINIKRLVREVTGGKITPGVGKMMLKSGYGLDDAQIEELLKPNAQFKHVDKIINTSDYALELFEAAAVDECTEDAFVSEEFVNFKSQVDCYKHEMKAEKQRFDDLVNNDIKKSTLDILKGNPLIKPEVIAKQLGVDKIAVDKIVNELTTDGLIEGSIGSIKVTDKGNNTEVPTVETEVYTVYKYVTRPDVPAVETTSRPFCKKMLALSRNGKEWTREALDNLSNALGEDAWVYRGGFYTNPDTHETTPYCRHVWKSIVKSRKKK